MAQVFVRFGVRVTLVEGGDRILSRDHPLTSKHVADQLVEEGLELRLGVTAQRIRAGGAGRIVELSDGSAVEGAELLVAVGRRAADLRALGAEDAGATLDDRGQAVTLPNIEHLRMVLQREFRMARFALSDAAAFFAALRTPGGERRIGCAFVGSNHYWLLSFDDRITQGLSLSMPMRALDVTVLHDVLLQRFLGLPPDVQKQKLTYTVDEEEALRRVAENQCQAAFFLNPTTFQQVADVCQSGETMPQKSTYFFPKLLTGMVFYKL